MVKILKVIFSTFNLSYIDYNCIDYNCIRWSESACVIYRAVNVEK